MARYTDSEFLRLESLRSYAVMDSASDKSLDYLVQNLAFHMDVPICYISFLDENRQWLKAKFGTNISETSRELAFCNLTIKSKLPLLIKNCSDHNLLKSHHAVTSNGGIRFYLGIPLISDSGQSIGTLCVMDLKPREFGITQIMHLQLMATMVMSVMDARKSAVLLKTRLENLESALRSPINNLTTVHEQLIRSAEVGNLESEEVESALTSATACIASVEEILCGIRLG